VAQTLADLGFARTDIHLVLDANRETLRRVKREFVESIRPGDLAFVYYSGHGVEVQGANYLLPVDLPSGASEEYMQDEAVSAQSLLREMEQRGANAARATNDKQVPSMYCVMLEDLVLLKGNARLALDQEAWDAVKNSSDPKALQQFIQEYPQSAYVRRRPRENRGAQGSYSDSHDSHASGSHH
jgi:hypothetical protein